MDPQQERDRGLQARLIGLAVVAVVLIVFIAQNYDDVPVDFLWVTRRMKLAWALLLSAALGFVLGLVAPRFRKRR